MSAKEMFEKLGYEHKIIDNTKIQCEDIILCSNKKVEIIIQFNLFSKLVCFQIKNKFEGYDKVAMFMTKELLNAINKQIEELGWNE